MFFGNFSEAQKQTVELKSIPRGETLRGLVEFCYTDDSKVLGAEDVSELIEFALIGNFYEIETLSAKVRERVQEKLNSCPSAACDIIEHSDVLNQMQGGWPLVVLTAWSTLRANPAEVLLGGAPVGVLSFSPKSLALVLRDVETKADEITLFSALRRWVGGQETADRARLGVAMELVKYIQLSRMPPSFLAAVVSTSGLVSEMDVGRAFAKQAQLFEASGMRTNADVNFEFKKQARLFEERIEGSAFKKARIEHLLDQPSDNIAGKSFAFVGAPYHDRFKLDDAWKQLSRTGAELHHSVTWRTDYLVVGSDDAARVEESDAYREYDRLRFSGQASPELICEAQFNNLMKRSRKVLNEFVLLEYIRDTGIVSLSKISEHFAPAEDPESVQKVLRKLFENGDVFNTIDDYHYGAFPDF
jgi:hypothetical protein